jgi:hypothetical protein
MRRLAMAGRAMAGRASTATLATLRGKVLKTAQEGAAGAPDGRAERPRDARRQR